MEERNDLKSIIAGLVIIIVGVVAILIDLFWLKTDRSIWISIGCSLLASGIVILAQVLLIEDRQENPLEKWGLEKIYETRAEKNQESDPELDKAKVQIDAVAFGLKAFRSRSTKKVEKVLKRGVNIRILTMNPDENNLFLKQREVEEQETNGQILNSIRQLGRWANQLNSRNYAGKVHVKGYKCMTLDFYWRVDDEIYIGPYWYHYGSQQTITYKFKKGKKGFDIYSEYFEDLWEDVENTVRLTKENGNG